MEKYLIIACICLSVGFRRNPEVAASEQRESGPDRHPCEICEERLNQQQEEIQELKTAIKNAGVTYVRWGRTACSAPATTVYTGHVGGTHFLEKGGGVNYLCLPNQPEWGNRKNGSNDWHAKVYGTEYESASAPIFSQRNNGGQSLFNNDALCAMCFVPNRSAQIMIPAKRTCPDGWTMEYQGYLVTDENRYSSKDFVCLDEAPEGLTGSSTNLNGALFYPVEGVCGSLPCPPYVNGWELACVVCSK